MGAHGRYLASASTDRSIALHNIELSRLDFKVPVEAAVTKISLSSRNPFLCLASLAAGAPELLNFTEQTRKALTCITAENEGNYAKSSSSANAASEAIFSRDAQTIFVIQARGTIAVLSASTLRHIDVIKVGPTSSISNMTLDGKGKYLLVNCSDRVVRLYSICILPGSRPSSLNPQEIRSRINSMKGVTDGSILGVQPPMLQLKREFTNAIERVPWRMAALTGNGEHVSAAVSTTHEHNIYIWDRADGRFVKVLEGPKESILGMAWHPERSLLATISESGEVYIWTRVYRENWAAFAPDFEELHDNYEYVEREDEFDIQDPVLEAAKRDDRSDDDEIDITTFDEGFGDDNDESFLHHLLVKVKPEQAPPAERPPSETNGKKASVSSDEGELSSSDNDEQVTGMQPAEDGLPGRRQRAAKARSQPLLQEDSADPDSEPAHGDRKRQKL